MKNYLFGIGGSGSKCIEALIHLFAMGIGPRNASIVLIDPDQSNGNLLRTQGLINLYKQVRNSLSDLQEGDFFFTDIEYSNKHYINPLDFIGKNLKLREYIKYGSLADQERFIIDLLYSDNELDMDLERGFRGVPSIGSFIMMKMNDEKYFKELIHDYISTDAKAFIFSSIFGGSGASGYPVISHVLKKLKQDNLVGGAILFPYFNLKKPAENPTEINPDSNTFLYKAIGALPFYNDTEYFKTDVNYVLGDYVQTKIHQENISGGREQHNDSHYIELFAALAALNFIYSDKKLSDDDKRSNVFYSIKVSTPEIDDSNKEAKGINYDISLGDLPKSSIFDLEKAFLKFGLFVNAVNDVKNLLGNDSLRSCISWLQDSGTDRLLSQKRGSLDELWEFIQSYMNWYKQMNTLEAAKLKIFEPNFSLKALLVDQPGKCRHYSESYFDKIFWRKNKSAELKNNAIDKIVSVINESLNKEC